MTFHQMLPLVQGAVTLILLVFVLRRSTKSAETRLFAGFLASMSLWGFFIAAMRLTPPEQAVWWEKIALTMIAFTAVFFYLFAIQYAKLKSRLRVILCVSYLLVTLAIAPTSLLVEGMGTDRYGNAPLWSFSFYLWLAVVYLLIIMAMVKLNTARKVSTSYEARNRYLFLIIGVGFCLIGGILDILPAFDIPVYPSSILGNIIFASLTAWAMIRYHLFDMRVILRLSLSYLGTGVVMILPLAGLMGLWLGVATSRGLTIWQTVLPLSVLVLLVPLIWQRLEAIITRRVLSERHAHLKALDEFSSMHLRADDPTEVYSAIVTLTSSAVQPLSACVLARTDDGSFKMTKCLESQKKVDFLLSDDHPIVAWLERNRGLLWRKQFNTAPELQAMTDHDREVLSLTDGDLYLPLGVVELIGILILGPKRPGQVYSRDDLDFLVAMTRQASLELENVRLFNQERAQRKRVEKFNAERVTFLDALAHELKTPLTSALSSSELLASELRNHPENYRLLSEDVWAAIKGLEHIVGDILDFGRSQDARLKLSMQRVDLCQLGLAMKDEFTPRLRTRNQDLSVTLPDTPVWTRADPERMKQVLRNLIDNAAKFSPSGSNICLQITALDRSVQIEVEDSAEPIDSQDQGHLFAPYYRGSKAQERHVPGLGLGLFISKQLVELQGGKIWLAKNEQRGNLFCIQLPKE